MKALHVISFILVIIGALNWGLIGIGGFAGANWDVLGMLLGSGVVIWIVYILVGLSAIYLIFTHKRDCKMCGMKAMSPGM